MPRPGPARATPPAGCRQGVERRIFNGPDSFFQTSGVFICRLDRRASAPDILPHGGKLGRRVVQMAGDDLHQAVIRL